MWPASTEMDTWDMQWPQGLSLLLTLDLEAQDWLILHACKVPEDPVIRLFHALLQKVNTCRKFGFGKQIMR